MDLITPSIGLVFWTTLSLLLLVILLRAFAWKPILASIHEREKSIEDALGKAEEAKKEMERLTNQNEELLKQARAERDIILKEAKELKDKIVSEAKTKAQEEGAKMIEKARVEIEGQKNQALAEVKTQVATLSLEIAEKVLRQQLADKTKQELLVDNLLKEIKL